MLVVAIGVAFYLTGGFSFHCFSTSSLTLPWAIAEFLHPFYTFSPAHRRVIRDTFNLTFLGFFSATVLSGHFLPTGVFYPTLLRLWLRCGQETPSRIFLCAYLHRLTLPADAWTWTVDVWITRLLIYQLCQWATKYRVKTELLSMFRLFKVICKDY